MSAILGQVPDTVRAGERNAEKGGYKYASIDSFYQHCRPAIAAAGLELYQDETAADIVDVKGQKWAWLKVTYRMALAPAGEEPKVWESITVAAPMYDAQTSGAVRSYAAKYWLRGKLMLATGETDLDGVTTPKPKPAPAPKRTTDGAATRFARWLTGLDASDRAAVASTIAEHYQGRTADALTDDECQALINAWNIE